MLLRVHWTTIFAINTHFYMYFGLVLENEERERERNLLPIRLLNVLNFLLQRQLFYSYIVSVANRVRIYSIFVVTFPITERSVAPAPLINITIYKIFIDDRFLKEMRIGFRVKNIFFFQRFHVKKKKKTATKHNPLL